MSAGARRRLPLFTFQSAGLSCIWCSARRLSQIAALLRNGLMVVGPALVHFALSQVLGLNLRFEIHDSDMSRLSLKMDGAAMVDYLLV